MLTSDFGNYSEIVTDSLTSESSEYLSSEIDLQTHENGEVTKKRTKPRPRTQKKVKYWTLPTMSTGTFNPSMLTARQQLQYLSQKSKLGEESESLELSPLRLDRIKFEEMRSMSAGSSSKEQNENNASVQVSPKSIARDQQTQTFSPRAGSKLKDEIASSPTNMQRKVKKPKKSGSSSAFTVCKTKTESVVIEKSSRNVPITVLNLPAAVVLCPAVISPLSAISPAINVLSPSDSSDVTVESRPSFFDSVKGLLFDYNQHRRNHFETFLKDFSKRLGLSPDDGIVKKKRDDIINKGMV